MPDQHDERLARARLSLEGLSVGDGFGGFFEGARPESLPHHLKSRTLPPRPWHFTDDTNMALSIFESLRKYGEINQDELALSFALHFDRARGYGASIRGLVARILAGQPWREVAGNTFSGQGSYGNGGAMRVAPLGAYFADDLDAVVEQARLSAEITHAHPEGIAGAIATAVAAALAWRVRDSAKPSRPEFIGQVLSYLPESEVTSGIRRARDILSDTSTQHAAAMLGNGSRISAQDTVPFVLWSAAEYLDNYEEAIWQTASAGGDVDTTCAMVGGIVAMNTGVEGIPPQWIESREPLPEWAFG
jgi:ADP-ribosylglycohydrolase